MLRQLPLPLRLSHPNGVGEGKPVTPAKALNGASIIAAIKASGIEYVLSVPDIVTSTGLLAPIARDQGLKLVRVCKEDECIVSAPGLGYSDKRALILIQHTGFLDLINAIRGIAVEYKQPICMMIGLLQHDPELAPRASPRFGVRIVEPILDAWASCITSSASMPTWRRSRRRSTVPTPNSIR